MTIQEKYASLEGNNGFLGAPTTSESTSSDGVGRYRHYTNGSIYWHPDIGAAEIHGAIRSKWSQIGWERSSLGYPLTDERSTPDRVGRYNHFQRGSIYWTPETGAHIIRGSIRYKWSQLGWEKSFLKYPTSDETKTPDGTGYYSHFQGGSIYWTQDTGAHEVHGAIRGKWSQLGWEKSFLKFPTTDERKTPDNKGRYNHFQGGSIYWTPQTGAHEVHGAIRQKWAQLGWERGFLKYPTTDETSTPDRRGRFNHFEGGSIYWTPQTGAHEVHGAIRILWSQNGWETRIGYPITDETSMNYTDNGRFNKFEKGVIAWTPQSGAWFDFTGAGGNFEGRLHLYNNANFSGANHRYNLSNSRPILFKNDLTGEGLHDNISSLKFDGIPNTCSVYLFQNANFSGRYTKITGKRNLAQHHFDNIGAHLNNRVSSVRIENHGTASVLISTQELETLAADQIPNIKVSGVGWVESPKVGIDINRRALFITIKGLIEKTWPDTNLEINIFFRPYVAGPYSVKFQYLGWKAKSDDSILNLASPIILGLIRKYFEDNGNNLANTLNVKVADRLTSLESLEQAPGSTKDDINIRRVNLLPEGFEVVLSDNQAGASLLHALGYKTDRRGSIVTNGST